MIFPREEHLANMVDKALDLSIEQRIDAAALMAFDRRLARIEQALAVLLPDLFAQRVEAAESDLHARSATQPVEMPATPSPASAPVVRPKRPSVRHRGYDDQILAALANGPLTGVEVTRAVLGKQDITTGQTGSLFNMLKRLCRAGRVVKRGDRRYELPSSGAAAPSFWTQVPTGESMTQRAEQELPRMQEEEAMSA